MTVERLVTLAPLHALAAFALSTCLLASPARADDDPPVPPPQDPGAPYVGILPVPAVPPGGTVLVGTSPWGVQQVFNAPELLMGQTFTAPGNRLDWIGFVFQNSTQPGWPEVPGAGQMRVSLYSQVQGGGSGQATTLQGLLGTSDTITIARDTTSWGVFSFAGGVNLTPGSTVWAHVEHVGGYPTWVGGRLNNVYSGGTAFGYIWNPFQNRYEGPNPFNGNDLVFAAGTVAAIPEPATALLMSLGLAAALWRARRRLPRA